MPTVFAHWHQSFVDTIAVASWQMNEAASLLRDARQYVPEATGIAEEIDEELPSIQDAVEALAALLPAVKEHG